MTTLAACQKLVNSWLNWNHDTVMCEYNKAYRMWIAKVEQICEPFRVSAIVHAKSRRAALAGLLETLAYGPYGRRP